MAYITVTNSFTSGTIVKAAEMNQNFTDITNGLSSGTKDLSVYNINCSQATFRNNATVGSLSVGNDLAVGTGYVYVDSCLVSINHLETNNFRADCSVVTMVGGDLQKDITTMNGIRPMMIQLGGATSGVFAVNRLVDETISNVYTSGDIVLIAPYATDYVIFRTISASATEGVASCYFRTSAKAAIISTKEDVSIWMRVDDHYELLAQGNN